MEEKQHTKRDLEIKRALPLDIKINMTQSRIRAFVDHYGQDGVYVSFSGGKDSTVLLHLVRELYPDIPAVFIDTGLEYPEIREFVKTFDNVEWIRPKMTFRKVIEKYGYPFPSKEVAKNIRCSKPFLKNPEKYKGRKPLPVQEAGEEYVPLALLKLRGELKTNGKKSTFNCDKWEFLLDSPYDFSEECCGIMKKTPVKEYEKRTGRKPLLATLTEESRMRMNAWLMHGCNVFEGNHQQSTPMAFWTEQDILTYIRKHNIPLAKPYGEIVYETDEENEGQITFADLGCEQDERKLKCTGLSRTGCMFCMFGCLYDQGRENRFEMMKRTHPKQYEYIMKDWEKGGLDYKNLIDWLNENGDLHIRY